MSDEDQKCSKLDRYPWRDLFGESVVVQLTALCDAASDIAAMRAGDRLRRLREAQDREPAEATDRVLLLVEQRLECSAPSRRQYHATGEARSITASLFQPRFRLVSNAHAFVRRSKPIPTRDGTRSMERT